MHRRMQAYIESEHLIEQGDRIIVGVSGGADSICLLLLMLKLCEYYKCELAAAHLNHGLRGQEADRDEAFVREFCEMREIPCYVEHVSIPELSANWGCSMEEAGRNARYSFFAKLCEQLNYCKIAIAHNKNDNAETILFHLIRGSGIKGLTGIPVKRGQIIRPLLSFERKEIEAYLNEQGIRVCSDQTNFENIYHRNRIRNRVVPELLEVNAGAVHHITAAAELLTEVYTYLECKADIIFERQAHSREEHGWRMFTLEEKGFLSENIVLQRLVLMRILNKMTGEKKDFQAVHIELLLRLFEKQIGRTVMLPHEVLVKRTYSGLLFQKGRFEKNRIVLEEKTIISFPFVYDFDFTGFQLHLNIIEYKKSMLLPQKCDTKWFDYDKIRNTVKIRTRREGDYFYINHVDKIHGEIILHQKRKSLKSFFIDTKIPREERDRIPLLAEDSHILWIPGEKASEAYRVDNKTKRVLVAELRNDNEKEGDLPWRKRSVF